MISCVLNLDSRKGVDTCEGGTMGDGAKSWNFFTDGLRNKLAFFAGHEVEVCIYIDQHIVIPPAILDEMAEIVGDRKYRLKVVDHKNIPHDYFYLEALRMATGEYVAHFDQDTFAAGDANAWMAPVISGYYKFVSYPCASSPDPDPDRVRWQNFRWASTRAFFCRREDLRLDDLEHCLKDPEWAWDTFGHPSQKCPWLEHFIGLMAGENQVFYPPLNDQFTIFAWSKYVAGTLPALNRMSMGQIQEYIEHSGGISWSGELAAGLNPAWVTASGRMIYARGVFQGDSAAMARIVSDDCSGGED